MKKRKQQVLAAMAALFSGDWKVPAKEQLEGKAIYDCFTDLDAYFGYLAYLLTRLGKMAALVNSRTDDGVTILHQIAHENKPDVLRLLVACGADVNALDGGGNSPLLWALLSYEDNVDAVVECLLESGANPNVVGDGGTTPLSAAKGRHRYASTMRLLKKHGAKA
jgi:ankyrin repeat protein